MKGLTYSSEKQKKKKLYFSRITKQENYFKRISWLG